MKIKCTPKFCRLCGKELVPANDVSKDTYTEYDILTGKKTITLKNPGYPSPSSWKCPEYNKHVGFFETLFSPESFHCYYKWDGSEWVEFTDKPDPNFFYD